MDLKEAEDIKNRWQEQTEELYKKDLNDPQSHDGVISHLELDILEYKVKWALGSTTMNKPSEDNRIPGMGSLVGSGLWGHTESDTTEATQQQQLAYSDTS